MEVMVMIKTFGRTQETLDKEWYYWFRFIQADGPTSFMLEAGNIDGAAIGLELVAAAKRF